MNKLSMALALAAALVGARTASATTYESYTIQGNSCISTTPGNNGIYSQWGPYNASSTTALNVSCPIALPGWNYTYAYILVAGWSRNSSDLLSCSIHSTGWDGYNHVGSTAYVPFYTAAAQQQSTYIYPSAGNGNLYVNCHIPVYNASGLSYLSNIFLTVGH